MRASRTSRTACGEKRQAGPFTTTQHRPHVRMHAGMDGWFWAWTYERARWNGAGDRPQQLLRTCHAGPHRHNASSSHGPHSGRTDSNHRLILISARPDGSMHHATVLCPYSARQAHLMIGYQRAEWAPALRATRPRPTAHNVDCLRPQGQQPEGHATGPGPARCGMQGAAS